MSDVHEKLVEILERHMSVDPARCTPDVRLVADLLFDSLAFTIGVVAIEEEFGVLLEQDALASCETLGDLEHLIVKATAS